MCNVLINAIRIIILIAYIYCYGIGLCLESLHLISVRDPFKLKLIHVYCNNATEHP